jgi:hypothetical protein
MESEGFGVLNFIYICETRSCTSSWGQIIGDQLKAEPGSPTDSPKLVAAGVFNPWILLFKLLL